MDWTQITLLIGIGFFIGFVGTLIGAGGGFMLTPILLLIYPSMRSEAITSISLGVIFLNAGSGSIAYARMKRIDYRSALAFALATLPGAVMGAFLTSYIPRTTFNILLGLLLIIISFFLLVKPHYERISKKKGQQSLTHRILNDSKGQHYEYSFNLWTGVIISFFVGFLSSLLGIGGGIIHVPALTALLNFPVHIATATSHLILAIMALTGTIVHIFQGDLKEGWASILYIGIGVIGGAQLGAYSSHHIKPKWIIRALALALLLVGIRIIFI
ncbi:MAG: sulfite exporter TauE/SafE family protein [Chitinophagales bacterium]